MGKLSEIKESYTVIEEEGSKGVLIYEDFDFSSDLYSTFYQIVHYGKEDISVVLTLLKTLNNISNITSGKNLEVLRDFSDYVYDNSVNNFSHKFDLELIKKARYSIDV